MGLVDDDREARVAWPRRQGIETEIEHAYEPGWRACFYDPDGIEVELVEYR